MGVCWGWVAGGSAERCAVTHCRPTAARRAVVCKVIGSAVTRTAAGKVDDELVGRKQAVRVVPSQSREPRQRRRPRLHALCASHGERDCVSPRLVVVVVVRLVLQRRLQLHVERREGRVVAVPAVGGTTQHRQRLPLVAVGLIVPQLVAQSLAHLQSTRRGQEHA